VEKHLTPETKERISILGSDYEAELFARVDPANVPRELGGTCECEGSCARSDAGPWVEDMAGLRAEPQAA
jgi:hypothetical protein